MSFNRADFIGFHGFSVDSPSNKVFEKKTSNTEVDLTEWIQVGINTFISSRSLIVKPHSPWFDVPAMAHSEHFFQFYRMNQFDGHWGDAFSREVWKTYDNFMIPSKSVVPLIFDRAIFSKCYVDIFPISCMLQTLPYIIQVPLGKDFLLEMSRFLCVAVVQKLLAGKFSDPIYSV